MQIKSLGGFKSSIYFQFNFWLLHTLRAAGVGSSVYIAATLVGIPD